MLVSSLCEIWDVESFGIIHPCAAESSASPFPARITLQRDRYSISLPWKVDHPEVPNHLSLCEGHLRVVSKTVI